MQHFQRLHHNLDYGYPEELTKQKTGLLLGRATKNLTFQKHSQLLAQQKEMQRTLTFCCHRLVIWICSSPPFRGHCLLNKNSPSLIQVVLFEFRWCYMCEKVHITILKYFNTKNTVQVEACNVHIQLIYSFSDRIFCGLFWPNLYLSAYLTSQFSCGKRTC